MKEYSGGVSRAADRRSDVTVVYRPATDAATEEGVQGECTWSQFPSAIRLQSATGKHRA